MNAERMYQHTQHAPLCLLVYASSALSLLLAGALWKDPALYWTLLLTGLLLLVLASAFHWLRITDDVDRLSIRFGPLPIFQRTILYADIVSVQPDRTTLLEGWGIHLSPRGGWVWNIWGRDCLVLQLRQGTLRLGTDDVQHLEQLLQHRIALRNSLTDEHD